MSKHVMRTIVGRVAGGAALVAGTWLAAADPAGALDGYGSQTQGVQDPLQTTLILVGVPVAIIALIALLSLAPTWTQSGRYNPGAGWFAEPMWLGQPDDAVAALPAAATTSSDVVVADPGGVSASW